RAAGGAAAHQEHVTVSGRAVRSDEGQVGAGQPVVVPAPSSAACERGQSAEKGDDQDDGRPTTLCLAPFDVHARLPAIRLAPHRGSSGHGQTANFWPKYRTKRARSFPSTRESPSR